MIFQYGYITLCNACCLEVNKHRVDDHDAITFSPGDPRPGAAGLRLSAADRPAGHSLGCCWAERVRLQSLMMTVVGGLGCEVIHSLLQLHGAC